MKKLIALIAISIFGALLLCGLCNADLIRFIDDIELGGDDVEIISRDADHVKVRVWPGTVTLNASRIKSITIDFDARVKSMEANGKNTAKNLFDLGALCDQNKMKKEATQAYKLALAKEVVPEEMLDRLARIFEKREDWPAAKAAYDRLLMTNPADESLRKKAAFCAEKAKNAPPLVGNGKTQPRQGHPEQSTNNGKVTQLVNRPAEPENNEPAHPDNNNTGPAEHPVEPEPPKKRDGLEANPVWRVEQWGNSATCEVVADDEDNRILSVAWTQRDKDKVAVRLSVDMDLSDKTKVTMDVYNNATGSARVGMAFNTLPGYQFFESLAFGSPLKKWTPVEIDLTQKKFKCAATNWRYRAEIANKDNIKDIFILIYNGDDKGAVFLDNISFHSVTDGK